MTKKRSISLNPADFHPIDFDKVMGALVAVKPKHGKPPKKARKPKAKK